MQITPESQSNLTTVKAQTQPVEEQKVAKSIEEEKAGVSVKDKLTLDGEQKAKDEKSVYAKGDKGKLSSAKDGKDGSFLDKLIEALKKQLEKLQAMLKSAKDPEAQQKILEQMSDVQTKLVEALEKKAQLSKE